MACFQIWEQASTEVWHEPMMAHGLLLWRQSKNQVFQDDVREKKREEGKDIRDLHRCQYTIFLPPSPAESSSLVKIGNLPNLIDLDFRACFGMMACFLLWKTSPFGSRPRPMKFKMTNFVIFRENCLNLTFIFLLQNKKIKTLKKLHNYFTQNLRL